MSICTTTYINQSVEDGTAGKASALRVFNVGIELAVGLSDANFQMRITQIEGRQAVQPVAARMDAFVDGGK
jgi:hypothetical protein